MTASHTDFIQSKVHLSPSEATVLSLLKLNEQTDTRELARQYYKGKVPMHGQIFVSSVVRRLAIKTARQQYRVKTGKRTGPHPVKVKLEKH